jgi:hypothetical protein
MSPVSTTIPGKIGSAAWKSPSTVAITVRVTARDTVHAHARKGPCGRRRTEAQSVVLAREEHQEHSHGDEEPTVGEALGANGCGREHHENHPAQHRAAAQGGRPESDERADGRRVD